MRASLLLETKPRGGRVRVLSERLLLVYAHWLVPASHHNESVDPFLQQNHHDFLNSCYLKPIRAAPHHAALYPISKYLAM